MKKQILLAGLLALSHLMHAQWGGSASQSGNIYRSGNVGIGNTMTNPLDHIHITDDNYSGSGGIRIDKLASGRGAVGIDLNNMSTGGKRWGLFSLGDADPAGAGNFALYDLNSSICRFLMHSNGNAGFGTTNPSEKVSLVTSVANDGLGITQTSNGASALHLYNSTTNGKHWALFSTGAGNTQGSGNFSIYEYGGTDRLFISGGTTSGVHDGNVGIGTITPGYAKLNVLNDNPYINAGLPQYKWAVKGTVDPQSMVIHGYQESDIGVEGDAINTHQGEGFMFGIVGRGSNGLNNYGGNFEATLGNNTYVGAANFGVKTKATGNYNSYGIYAEASGATNLNWAGYFQGNVNINGAAFCTASAWSSDLKLKKDVKPLTNSLALLRQLKPSTYTFKNDEEFREMNLPKEQQLGLIAQDLEKVLPQLVIELGENIQKDAEGKVISKIPAHKMVNYIGLIPVLISALQEQDNSFAEQQKITEQLAQTNAELKKQLDEQKELINSLSQKVSGTTGMNDLNVEAGFQMAQNEPNPFTHETVVKYTMPQTVSNAFMAVYDLTGKQIATFPVTQKGSSSITITSEKLAAGIYIYSIVADGRVIDSKRMIVAEK